MFGINGIVLLVCSILCSWVIADGDYGYAFINGIDSDIFETEDPAIFEEKFQAQVTDYYQIMAEEQHDSGDEAKSVNLEDAVVVFDDLKFDGIAGDSDLQTNFRESFLHVADKSFSTVVLIKCKNRDEVYRQRVFQIIENAHPGAIYMYIYPSGQCMATIPINIQNAYATFSEQFVEKTKAKTTAVEEKAARDRAEQEEYAAGKVEELN